jgi:hypothetical protein
MEKSKGLKRNIMEAKKETKDVLDETDKRAADAEELVGDLKAVTEGLEGILQGGISEEDNSKLESIVREARDVANSQYLEVDEKRRELIDRAGMYRDQFQAALGRKKVDRQKLDQTLQRLTSDRVRKLVKEAVDSSEREAETYDGMQQETDEAKKEDERQQRVQDNAANFARSINVKVG